MCNLYPLGSNHPSETGSPKSSGLYPKRSNSDPFGLNDDEGGITGTVPLLIPELISKMTVESEHKIRSAASQIATMICTPQLIKGPSLVEELMSSPKQPSGKFRFAIPEMTEEDDKTVKSAEAAKSRVDEVLIIGLSNAAVREITADSDGIIGRIKAEPEVLFSWPSHVSNMDVSDGHLSKQIKNFVFPFGYYMNLLPIPGIEDSSSQSPTNENSNFFGTSPSRRRKSIITLPIETKEPQSIAALVHDCIVKDPIGNNKAKNFFLCFNSEETLAERKQHDETDEECLKLSNPNMYYNYYGILIEELVCLVVFTLFRTESISLRFLKCSC